MLIRRRLNYYRRIFAAYLTPGQSQLTFWHDTPEANENAQTTELGEYYMTFAAKADYPGAYDAAGIPLLDYRGALGLQYNPIAIAQYGLGNYNQSRRTGNPDRRRKFMTAADWLVANLADNAAGLAVWNHHFDFEYRTLLKAPWYSALAQGQGISLLVRAHRETGDPRYLEAASRAFEPFLKTIDEGGVAHADEAGGTWFEEYLVDPPTHVLNGFIWASWGVYDYFLATGKPAARELFDRAIETLATDLPRYDVGFWSVYDQPGTRLRNLASPLYHRLHVVQLTVLHQLTGKDIFQRYATRWEEYRRSAWKRALALSAKSLFKLVYY